MVLFSNITSRKNERKKPSARYSVPKDKAEWFHVSHLQSLQAWHLWYELRKVITSNFVISSVCNAWEISACKMGSQILTTSGTLTNHLPTTSTYTRFTMFKKYFQMLSVKQGIWHLTWERGFQTKMKCYKKWDMMKETICFLLVHSKDCLFCWINPKWACSPVISFLSLLQPSKNKEERRYRACNHFSGKFFFILSKLKDLFNGQRNIHAFALTDIWEHLVWTLMKNLSISFIFICYIFMTAVINQSE